MTRRVKHNVGSPTRRVNAAPRLAAEVKAILADPRRSDAIRRELAEIRQKLGEPGAARRAAAIALGLMKPGHRAKGEKT